VAEVVSVTKHNRRILTLAAAILAIAGVGVFALRHREDRVTKQNSDRITEGMSLAEVELILGGPPGDYTTRPRPPCIFIMDHWGYGPDCANLVEWDGDSGIISVAVNVNGTVADWRYWELTKVGPFDVLIWSLQCQWRRWFPD
jgi:hypothetical protein